MNDQHKLIQCMDARIEKLEKLLYEKELQLTAGKYYYPDFKRSLDTLENKCKVQVERIHELESWTTHLQKLCDDRKLEIDGCNAELKKVCEWAAHLNQQCGELQMEIDKKNQEIWQLQNKYNDLQKKLKQPIRSLLKKVKIKICSMIVKGVRDGKQ